MGGSLFFRVMPQIEVKSVRWLLPFLSRCTKTKPNQKLEPCPLDKEHPVSWRHSTSGGLMLLLSNAWPGDTVILCLTSLQGESWHLKGTKKLLHVMPRHPLLFHWEVGACEVLRHELMELCWGSASQPRCQKPVPRHMAPHSTFQFLFLSCPDCHQVLDWNIDQGGGTITVTAWDWLLVPQTHGELNWTH